MQYHLGVGVRGIVCRSLNPLIKVTRRGLTKHVLVDSFAAKPFSGNPAAVVFQQGRDSWMQNVASELNSPVTAFIKKSDLPGSAFDIRW